MFNTYIIHALKEKGVEVRKGHFVFRPSRTEDIDFDDLYEELSSSWRAKAHALQKRRWRKLELEESL